MIQDEREAIIERIRELDNPEMCDLTAILRNDGIDCENIQCSVCMEKATKNLLDLLKSNGIPWPLDRDGVPITIGDTVYWKDAKYVVKLIDVRDDPDCPHRVTAENAVDYKWLMFEPNLLSHKKPRTMEDIQADAYQAHKDAVSEEYVMIIDKLLDEARELGRREALNEQ